MVVTSPMDVFSFEKVGFKGVYHVLGGKISPIDGVGPSHLNISSLVTKVQSESIEEVIFALSSTMEGDTTNFYIFKQIKEYEVKTSTIALSVTTFLTEEPERNLLMYFPEPIEEYAP